MTPFPRLGEGGVEEQLEGVEPAGPRELLQDSA
jgi:hypothetical protein